MNKSELRERLARRRAMAQTRDDNESEIINNLPDALDYKRVTPAWDTRRPDNGGIELEVLTYEGALSLIESHFKPMALARVRMQRERGFKTSFWPDSRVPQTWPDEHEVMEVFPVLWQMRPVETQNGGNVLWDAQVNLEWYTMLGPCVVNVRCVVTHPKPLPYYKNLSKKPQIRAYSDWDAKDYPRGEIRRVNLHGVESPPYVTVYWWDSMLEDLAGLMHTLCGEVALHG
jgi:hypothetical protein